MTIVHHTVSGSDISKMVWPWITTFYRYIHTDILYSHIGYDLNSCGNYCEETRKCRLRWLHFEFLKNVLSEDCQILQTCLGLLASHRCRIWHHLLLPVSCKMHLNTAEKCMKWVWLTKSLMSRPLFNVESPYLHGHPCQPSLQPLRMWRHQLHAVWIFKLKNGCKCHLWMVSFLVVNLKLHL